MPVPRPLFPLALLAFATSLAAPLGRPLSAQSDPEVSAALARAAVRAALTQLEQRTPQMAAGLVELGAIESPSGREQARAAVVERRMRAMGLADVRVDSISNVIGRIKGRSGKAIVFVSTLDDLTSIAALQRAAGAPPRIDGDRVVGPGTNTSSTTEALLAAAEVLLAYRGWEGGAPLHDLVFAAVAQEETGLRGMKALYAALGASAVTYIDVLGDGSSITYGALGIHWSRVLARGPGGHSLTGGLPNVNQAIARSVDRILSLPQPSSSNNPQRTILNVAVLRSGELYNHKPDTGWFSVDIRSLDALTIAQNEAAVSRILREVSTETGIALSMEPVSRTPGGQIAGADTSRVVRLSTGIARSMGLTPRLGNAGSANLNVPLGNGTRAIGIGSERGGRRGYPDEWASIPMMLRTAKHITLLGVLLGEGDGRVR